MNSIEQLATYIGIILILCLVVVFGLKFIIPKTEKYKGSDPFGYINILLYILSVFDFWTDVFLVYFMFLQCEETLFFISGAAVIISFILSLVFAIFWIYRWRLMTTTALHRITDYLHEYSVGLMLFSMFGDFYSCVLLVTSKLFCLKIFHLPLKRKEAGKLIVYKFINTTLAEV